MIMIRIKSGDGASVNSDNAKPAPSLRSAARPIKPSSNQCLEPISWGVSRCCGAGWVVGVRPACHECDTVKVTAGQAVGAPRDEGVVVRRSVGGGWRVCPAGPASLPFRGLAYAALQHFDPDQKPCGWVNRYGMIPMHPESLKARVYRPFGSPVRGLVPRITFPPQQQRA